MTHDHPRRTLGRTVTVLVTLALGACPVVAGATMFVARAKMDENAANYHAVLKHVIVPPANQGNPDFGGNDIDKIRPLEDPVRREIYESMHKATEPFHFRDRAHAQENFLFRTAIIRNMHDMNARRIDFAYYDSKAKVPPSVASALWGKGPLVTWQFVADPNAKSSDAIVDLLKTKTRGECNGALTASVLGAAHEALGPADFDKLHPPGTLDLLYDGRRRHQSSARDRKTQVPGDLVYMKNHDYDVIIQRLQKQGAAQGWNLIFVGTDRAGKKLYAGLGLNDRTEDEVRQTLKAAYINDLGFDPFFDGIDRRKTIDATKAIRIIGIERMAVTRPR